MTADLSAALDRIEGLAAAVTKGATLDRYDHGGGRLARFDGPERLLVADFYHEGDREFYTAASTDLPRLAAVVRAVLGVEEKHRRGDYDLGYEEALDDIRAAATKAWEDGR